MRKRLQEFGTKEFFKITPNNLTFADRGFLLGIHEYQKLDGILSSKPNSYSDVDLIKALADVLPNDLDENTFIEELAYFLCGYDHFKIVENDVKEDKPKIPTLNFFDQAKRNLPKDLTKSEIEEKKDFIREVLL